MERFLNTDVDFRKHLFSRLIADCLYYLGCPEWHEKQLWGHSVKGHIRDMRLLYSTFSDKDKPEWFTDADMERLKYQMEICYYDKKAQELIFDYQDVRYEILARMQADCKYYMEHGTASLWAGTEAQQIACMKAFYNSFPDEEKPEWITMEEIKEYEAYMVHRN